MTRTGYARLAGLAVATATTVVVWNPAATADSAVKLFVNNQSNVCSDTGPGTQAVPFCTISAAAAMVGPGQTVSISGTSYPEHVTIDRSGTPSAPITFVSATGLILNIRGATFSVSGQHDITFNNMKLLEDGAVPGVEVTASSQISINGMEVTNKANGPGYVFHDVTDSVIHGAEATVTAGAGILVDGDDRGLMLKSPNVSSFSAPTPAPVTGIDVAGSGVTIVDGTIDGVHGDGIVVERGVSHTTVVNNVVAFTDGIGVHDLGANASAITNNYVQETCGSEILVEGAATGASIENNVAQQTGLNSFCVPPADAVGIGVVGGATESTTVDYNTVFDATKSRDLYAWGTPIATLQEFRSVSGQGDHDLNVNPLDNSAPDVDSANSAAPGWQGQDNVGRIPEDDPAISNNGAGPIAYADRGISELVSGPTERLVVTPSLQRGGLSVTADASASTPGWIPITSYIFAWGDGTTTTQATPIATHRYTLPANYTVAAAVSDANKLGTEQRQTMYPTYVPSAVALAHAITIGPGQTRSINTTTAPPGADPIQTISVLAINLAVESPAAGGSLVAYPTGSPRPQAPSLSFVAGQSASTLTLVSGASKTIDVFNSSTRNVTVSIDLEGAYQAEQSVDRYDAAPEQKRLLDTRSKIGVGTTTPLRPNGEVAISIPAASSPLPNADAAVLRVTTTHATGNGNVQVFSSRNAEVMTPTVAVVRGANSTNLVVVPLEGPTVDVLNMSSGDTDVMVDLVGFYGPSELPTQKPSLRDAFQVVNQPGATVTLAASRSKLLSLPAPTGATAAFMRVTVAGGTTAGSVEFSYLTGNATIAWQPRQVIQQMLIVPLKRPPSGGRLSIANPLVLINHSDSAVAISTEILGYNGLG